MKATHWTAFKDPETWNDNPIADPTQAALDYCKSDDGWDERHDVFQFGKVEIIVYGFVETDKALEPEDRFDGYEPGCTYFEPTNETQTIIVKIIAEVK